MSADVVPVLPRRRDLRASAPAPRARRGAGSSERRRGSFGERHAIGEPRPSARPTTPLVAPSATKRRGWSALITVLVVPGLFATAGLPAYASGAQPEADTAAARAAGQSFVVSAEAASAAIARDGLSATSEEEMQARRADPRRAARLTAYAASGALEMGDDYPWFYQAADYEGGGLSPLGYYYRECVDFVAWRLNRDAGTTQAPFKWTWSKMTPRGGDASQWAMNWKANGWETGQQPVAGSVAWFAGNHVAYVKEVLDDGRVLIEEYNHKMQHKYGQRILDRSDIALFLYAPPA